MKTLMEQEVDVEYYFDIDDQSGEGKVQAKMGDVVTGFAGVVFNTMPEVTSFKSKMFKDGIYRAIIIDDDGECIAFLKVEAL